MGEGACARDIMGRLAFSSARRGWTLARASAEDVSRGVMSRAFSPTCSVASTSAWTRVGATATPIASIGTTVPRGRGVEGVRTFASSTTNSSAGAMKTSETTSSAAEARAETTVDDGLNLSQGARRNDSYMLFHPQYDLRQVENVKPAHRKPIHVRDYIAYGLVQFSRWSFDKITGYSPKTSLTPEGWLQRFIFLETVAGVPGMVGAMLRHMMSLRTLKRDHGWIHTLLEEAENERMHLLTFLKLREPGIAFRLAVLGAQGVFFNAFFLSYLISPRTCHRFVGYLEEEAVRTYTHALHDIDGGGPASVWATQPAPKLAKRYWRMPEDATVRDLIVAVRADEASHSHVNHTLSSMGTRQSNPFHVGHTELPENFVEPPPGFVPEHCR